MHGHKNIPSANPLFSGIIMSSPILHISTIRVKDTVSSLYYDASTDRWITNSKGRERKRVWPNLRYCPEFAWRDWQKPWKHQPGQLVFVQKFYSLFM